MSRPFPYKGKVFSPSRSRSSNYSACSPHWLALLVHLTNPLPHISGSRSCYGSVLSHDPPWLPLYPVRHLLFFICHLGQTTHIFSYLHSTPICLTHSHLFLIIYLSHGFVSPLFSLSHNVIAVLLTLRELSHYLVMVTCHMSHTLGT